MQIKGIGEGEHSAVLLTFIKLMMMILYFPPWYRRAFYNKHIHIYDNANICTINIEMTRLEKVRVINSW